MGMRYRQGSELNDVDFQSKLLNISGNYVSSASMRGRQSNSTLNSSDAREAPVTWRQINARRNTWLRHGDGRGEENRKDPQPREGR